MRRVAAALAAVVILAAVLRFHRIGSESLWLDEAISHHIATQPPGGIIEQTTFDVHPPLYYFLLHYWMILFGSSEAAMRSLSATLDLAAIVALFKLGSRLGGRSVGLMAALLVAVSTFHVAASQETRMYALLGCLSVLSMDGFLQIMVPGPVRRTTAVIFVVVTASMLYTHVYGWFVLAAQAAWVGIGLFDRDAGRPVWRRAVALMAIAVALFLPWAPILIDAAHRVQQGFWIDQKPALSLVQTLVAYAGSDRLAWVILPLAGAGLLASRPRRDSLFLIVWLTALLVLPFLISHVSAPIFRSRYTISGSFAVYLLAARGAALLPARWQAIPIAAILLLSIAPLRDYYRTPQKEQWRDLLATVQSQARAGDLVIFNPDYLFKPYDYYVRRPDLPEVRFLEDRPGLDEPTVRARADAAASGHDRIWLVATQWDPATATLTDELERTYRIREQQIDRGVAVSLLEKRSPVPASVSSSR